jgi:hypothetical protein
MVRICLRYVIGIGAGNNLLGSSDCKSLLSGTVPLVPGELIFTQWLAYGTNHDNVVSIDSLSGWPSGFEFRLLIQPKSHEATRNG